jgi:tryptophan synthase alpha chain
LKSSTESPVAVGFGVTDRTDITALWDAGADAAIVGSAGVRRVEQAIVNGGDVIGSLHAFVLELLGITGPSHCLRPKDQESQRRQTSDRT